MCIFAAKTAKYMIKIVVSDEKLKAAAEAGMDEFMGVFVDAIQDAIGDELTAENMSELNSDQITLVAYHMLREEVMDGGFVQLIHNGYGSFFFHNPFAKAMRQWGIPELAKLMNKARKLYTEHHEEIERDCTEDDFMALFERFPKFDDLDDEFVEAEEEWTEAVALYIDNNIEKFAVVE